MQRANRIAIIPVEKTPPNHSLCVDGRLKRIKRYAFSNENAYVWTGPDVTHRLGQLKTGFLPKEAHF